MYCYCSYVSVVYFGVIYDEIYKEINRISAVVMSMFQKLIESLLFVKTFTGTVCSCLDKYRVRSEKCFNSGCCNSF